MKYDLLHIQGKPYVLVPLHDYRDMVGGENAANLPEDVLDQLAARVSTSLLSAVGLPALITEDEQSYRDLILDLASHPEKLKTLREKLASMAPQSALFDIRLHIWVYTRT